MFLALPAKQPMSFQLQYYIKMPPIFMHIFTSHANFIQETYVIIADLNNYR